MEVNKIINKVHCVDCLDFMSELPDNSIDLVLTDPPYNIGKDSWDKIDNYIDWLGSVFLECQRILRDNGTFYWFHQEIDVISQIMEWLRNNTDFQFNSFIIWDKGDFRALSWKNPTKDNNLRSWFNVCEYCLCYTLQNETGLKRIGNDLALYKSIRDYFKNERLKIKLSYKEINEKCFGTASNGGGMASNILTSYKDGWSFPTKEKYQALQKIGICKRKYEDLHKEYEDLRKKYERLRYSHNLDKDHKNIWRFNTTIGDKRFNHLTQKPLPIISRMIQCSSNKNDLVFDPFLGSGTTAVAAQALNRNFIGIEIDKKYCEISRQRLRQKTLL